MEPPNNSRRIEKVEDHPVEDFSGSEICSGDSYFRIDGEVVLVDNLEDYVLERLGASLETAK